MSEYDHGTSIKLGDMTLFPVRKNGQVIFACNNFEGAQSAINELKALQKTIRDKDSEIDSLQHGFDMLGY